MVQALEEEQESYRSRLFHFKGMNDNRGGGGGQTRSLIMEGNNGSMSPPFDDKIASRSHNSAPSNDPGVLRVGAVLNREDMVRSRFASNGGIPQSPRSKKPSDMEQMKEKFAKLLLGEDMSGGRQGVSSALALSNAITNLAASVFGEQKRLEPMAPETKVKWRKEIDWLLSVTDHIVEMVPVKQVSKDGTNMEVMNTRQRADLHMNIPALRKLDAMLLDCLDNFKDQHEFNYETKDSDDSQKGKHSRKDEKWWIPTPKVPPNGLSEVTRKWLQFQKDSVNQVLKAAMAINAQVLMEMEIPESYIDSLPKNGRASLGDLIYKSITDDYFDPDYLLSSMDLSSEHKILDLKNRIEASIIIWKRKMTAKDGKSSWGSGVSLEKREIFEDRAETILLIIKHRFPGIPQSSLDISKIQYNQDVGQAILESYSRIIESLAFTVLSRIDDVIHADSVAQNPSTGGEQRKRPSLTESMSVKSFEKFDAKEEVEKLSSADTPPSMTLSDFMGWTLGEGGGGGGGGGDNDIVKKKDIPEDGDVTSNDTKILSKQPADEPTNKKLSYIERLELLGGCRSPTARH